MPPIVIKNWEWSKVLLWSSPIKGAIKSGKKIPTSAPSSTPGTHSGFFFFIYQNYKEPF